MKFPYPDAWTALQYFISAADVLLHGRLKLIEHDSFRASDHEAVFTSSSYILPHKCSWCPPLRDAQAYRALLFRASDYMAVFTSNSYILPFSLHELRADRK